MDEAHLHPSTLPDLKGQSSAQSVLGARPAHPLEPTALLLNSLTRHKEIYSLLLAISIALIGAVALFWEPNSIIRTLVPAILAPFVTLLLGLLLASHTISSKLQSIRDSLKTAHRNNERAWFAPQFESQNAELPARSGLLSVDDFVFGESCLNDVLQELSLYRAKAHVFQRRYEILTENLAASVLIRNHKGELLFCSTYTEVLTGYTREEILEHAGDFLEDIALKEGKDRYQRAKRISELGEDMLVRFAVMHKSGIKLWFETRLVPLVNDDGENEAVMSVTVDVTASVNYQKQIEEQNQDLKDFSAMVSHDLKAPLFTIHGMASALKQDYSASLDSEGKALLGHILDATQFLEKLVGSILQYSSVLLPTAAQASVEVETMVEHVQGDLYQLLNDSNGEVIIEQPLGRVRCEEVRVYQVFLNLISNALKYRRESESTTVIISAKQVSEHFIEFSVLDNSRGIPQEDLSNIFRAYKRTNPGDIEGTGIGLACVKKIVESYGGEITVKSAVAQGSCFTFTLPGSKQHSATHEQNSASV